MKLRQPALLAGGLAVGLLTLLAARFPGLRFVDMIQFSVRAQALMSGERLVDGLYPIGYPALLLVVRAVTGDVLLAGKIVSVLAGAGLVAFIAGRFGGRMALWMGLQIGVLVFGSTEGTDQLAASLMVASVLTRHPMWAGGLVGAACLVRYTGIAALPAVLLLSHDRRRVLTTFLLATSPHWGLALLTGTSPLPTQDLNATIGAGHTTTLWSVDTLRRWPVGAGRAALAVLADPPNWLGLVGVGFGLHRRDRAAAALLGLAVGQMLLIGLGFANARLVLPASLALAAGVAWIPWVWAPAVAAPFSLLFAWPALRDRDPALEQLDGVVAATRTLEGPALANNPWYHQHHGGWLVPAVQLSTLVRDPPSFDPDQLQALCRAQGFRYVALDLVRTRRSYPRLAPLVDPTPPAPWVVQSRPTGWRVLTPDGPP